jgi:hypoxanthine phosphoribosyltransferase
MKPYDYAHRLGVRPISWDDFASLAARLAESLESYHPDLILGIARAGLFPATLVACNLRRELFPIRLTRRVNDQVLYDHPVWKVPIPAEVAGKMIAIVDEIADTGQTLSMVAEQALGFGAQQVITASLVSHSWADPTPQICPLITDEFVIFPWDERVLEEGKWIRHPEIVAGLRVQRHGLSG